MAPKVFTSRTQRVGELGETIAVTYIVRKGFVVLERNYTRKWGEIDIIARKEGVLYFFEVKATQWDGYQPENNMHQAKLVRLRRTLQTYLLENGLEDQEWRFGLLAVFLDHQARKARVRIYDNLII